MLIAGIEEAGRGPVIGPMVMAGVLIDEKDEKKLIEIKVKDSKLLTPKQRENLFDKIKKIAKKHKITIIRPDEIDAAIEAPLMNLNLLEAIRSADIANELKPDKVILDCPSNNIKDYKMKFGKYLKIKPEVIAEHKADVKYPVVSAASILAKVTRDREIEKMRKKYGDFGSGYPADPKTQAFLDEHFEDYPEIFRVTWDTYKNVVRRKLQRTLKEF